MAGVVGVVLMFKGADGAAAANGELLPPLMMLDDVAFGVKDVFVAVEDSFSCCCE